MKREKFLIRQNLAWVLNGYQRLWKVILNWYQNPGSAAVDSTSRAALQFLTSLEPYREQESSRSGPLQSDMEFSQMWLRCLSEAFRLDDLCQMSALQLGLSSFLCRLSEATNGPNMLAECMDHTLLPVLIDVKKGTIFRALDPELQVSSANYVFRKSDRANQFSLESTTRPT